MISLVEPSSLPLSRRQKIGRWFFIFGFLICLSGVLWVSISYHQAHANVKQEAFSLAQKQADQAAEKINKRLQTFVLIINQIAEELNTGQLAYGAVESRLKSIVASEPEIVIIGLGFKPYQYRPDLRLYAPFQVKNSEGQFGASRLDEVYDYTKPSSPEKFGPKTDWYRLPLEKNSPVWLTPYYGKVAGQLIMVYTVPFYAAQQPKTVTNQKGIVMYGLSLGYLDYLLSNLTLGKTGYGCIVSQEGSIVSHPVRELIGQSVKADPMINQIFHQDFSDKLQTIINQKTGQTFWVIKLRLPSSPFYLCVLMNQEDFLLLAQSTMQKIGLIVLFSIVGFLCLMGLSLRIYRVDVKKLQYYSGIVALSFLLGIVLVASFSFHLLEPDSGIKMIDSAILNRYLDTQFSSTQKATAEDLTYIPTALFIQNLFFTSAHKAEVSGQIWQQYPKSVKERGVVFPQQAGEVTLEPAFEISGSDYDTVGWHFNAILFESFLLTRYPFDQELFQLRLWPQSTENNLVLVPALETYQDIRPDLRPGLNPQMQLKSWHIAKSFFSYESSNYFYRLNEKIFKTPYHIPELVFNVHLKRKLLNPILLGILPLIIIASLLFVVMVFNKTEMVISTCGGLFFAVALIHRSISEGLMIDNLSYIDVFYLMMYFMLLLVASSYIAYARSRFWLFAYQDNLMIKLLYWPIIFGVIFGVTLVHFSF